MDEYTLRIPSYLLDSIVMHARCGHPKEVCGILSGNRKTMKPSLFIPIDNVSSDPEKFFEMGPESLIAAYRKMDAIGHDPLVIYHSHTSCGTYPSRTDVESVVDLDPVQLICSTEKSVFHPSFQAWRYRDGGNGREAVEVAMDIIDSAHPESPIGGLVEGNHVRVTYDGMGGRRTVVATVGRRGGDGDSVILILDRPGATGPVVEVALDRIRAVGILTEGTRAADVRRAATQHLEQAVAKLSAHDVVGARESIGAAGALMPRLIPVPPPLPRAYRPRRRGE